MGKLTRLELYNFKSYKGLHILPFGDAFFTCIIGPNGSGKSNSMDAISFVLGIKSSHLRSTQLKDLVYRGRVMKTSVVNEDGSATVNGANGTNGDMNGVPSYSQERGDPKGAWVMAVYEDDAGEEQLWKRSITSQGASEYRINNRVVTAQQYNNALESENILIKARNFLCFQGDVEQIASQSPRDLTRLIEQISGSLEHKADYERLKQVMEEAIENQNFTLNRRRGINSEIKQYQEQKREADQFSQKTSERDQAIVRHILYKLYRFQSSIEQSTSEIQNLQEELKEFRRNIAEHEENLEVARREQAKVSREAGKIERSITAKDKQAKGKNDDLVPTVEKIQLKKEHLVKIETNVAAIRTQRDAKKENLKKLAKDMKTVEKAESQWEVEWKKIGEAEGRVLSEADIQEYNKLKEEANRRTSAGSNKAATLAYQEKAEAETVKSLQSTVEREANVVRRLQDEITVIEQTATKAKETVKSTTKEIETKKQDLKGLTSERLRVTQIRTELEEKLQTTLRKIVDAEDGRHESEKELRTKAMISDLKRIFPGVKGRVTELCKPKQKKFTEAVSTAVGRHMDSVIVEEEKTANQCMAYLREQQRGVLTFIPLDTISVKAIDSNLKGMKNTRMAIDAIDYDKSVDRAMLYICGNAVICDDHKTAWHICYDRGIGGQAITLDGRVISRGGLVTGGRGRDHNAKRWEDSEVDALRKVAEQQREKLQGLPDVRRHGMEEQTSTSQLSMLEQKLAEARSEANSFERNLKDKQKELAHAEKSLNDAKPQYNQRSKELEALRKELQTLKNSSQKVENQIFASFCKRLNIQDISVYEAQQGTVQEEARKKKLDFSKQRNRLKNQIDFEQQQLDTDEARIRGLENGMKQDQSLIKELENEKKKISKEIDGLEAEREMLQSQLSKQKEVVEQKQEIVAEKKREVQKRSRSIETATRSMSEHEADIQRSAAEKFALLRKCKLEDISVPLAKGSNSLDKLPVDGLIRDAEDPDAMDVDGGIDASLMPQATTQDYGIEIDFDDLDDDLKETNEQKVEDDLQSRITTLDEELKNMAPNLKAMERLEGVESRLKSTEKDFEDARRAAKRAKDDFQEIKDQRFELFNKAFTHISDQIGPIYKELTRSSALPMGGQAYLDMEDSDEPYLDGIKYHAMPPLKRFRDMEHLSGGEKTMAALALLFAIHSYQPSPFFVLDEVDAALDNANVQKIASYIREHSGPGMQFIVISLKMGLFQYGDTLVGIHRDQTYNTSKALTLDLRKYEVPVR